MEIGGVFEDAYEILSLLGEGGFGVVYQARQRTTGQLVAIKTVIPHAIGSRAERMIARFMRETRLCAQLYHPNIVQLINAGKTAEGQLYTVFAYAPGKSLSQVLSDEGALDPEEARHLMLQVLDALACAHARGIIHRDLKPGNIMVIPTGARRNALVLDFGIGTVATDMSSTEHARLTATSEVLGTPGYAAPEQLNSFETTAATDLFSWGLVFIECLTGRPVYSGATLREILFKQLGADPVGVPAALQRHPLGKLLEEVTRKDPAARPQDAGALLKRLEGCSLRGVSRAAVAGDSAVPAPQGFVTTAVLKGMNTGGAATEELLASERRYVTALCCSLKLRAAQGEPAGAARNLDVEEQNRSLIELFDLCSRVVAQHHGLLAATFGEQALFFFGYPRADEQDARRAAGAALALRGALAAEGERLQRRGLELAARAGIHSGLVVAPASQDVIDASLTIGVTPAVAARIAERASSGSAVVSGAVQRILRSTFDFDAQGVLDEPSGPLKLFRLEGQHAGGAATAQSSAPFIGREPELKLLAQRWAQARQGTGQCSLISGEPGIGKSRLALALRRRIEEEPHVSLSLRSSPDAQNSPLFPVIDLIERLLDREGDGAQTGRLARLESLLSRHGLDPSTNVPLLAALLSMPLDERYQALDVSPELQKKRTLEAIRLLLFAVAEARPAFMLVEDLHWADPTTLELLGQMIERASSAPVYIVLTARPDFSQTSLPAASVLQISLSRLGSDDVEALVAELFDGRDLPEEVLEQIIKRTDGVPLFIEEFSQMLIESGALVLRGEGYELARPLRDSDIPSSLRDLLTSRLDRLGKAKETAQLAATLGREFGLSLLAATSERGTAEVQADLEELQAAGLIQSKRKKDDRGYIFKHALIRDAAYESMSLAARRLVHARVARTLEERFSQIVEARPDLLAHHHAAAEQKRTAIGYAQRAAGAALRRSAYTEAGGHVSQAQPWLTAIMDERERIGLELDLSSLSMLSLMNTVGYGSPVLKTLTSRIIELSDSLGKSPQTFTTLYALTIYYHVTSGRAKALELAERLVRLAQESGDVPQDMAAHAVLSQCFAELGRYEEARAAAERTLSLHDPVKHRDLALMYGVDPATFAQIVLGWTLTFMGYLDQGLAVCERAIAWARELNNPNMLSLSLFYCSYSHRVRREREAVLEVTGESVALADRYGLEFNRAYTLMMRGWATRDVPELSRVIQAHKATGQIAGTQLFLSGLAEAEANEGQLAQAIEHIGEAIRFAEEQDDHFFYSGALRLEGMFLLQRDPRDLEAAEARFRRAIDVARRQHAKTEELDATIELARVLMKTGRGREAYEMLSPLYAWFKSGFEIRALVEARALLDELRSSTARHGEELPA